MSDFSKPDLVDQLFEKMKEKKWTLVTAESCTGGMIATAITDKQGASNIFERGFVTYSNESKIECLGVSHKILNRHGAVSAEVAEEMAKGALENSGAKVSVAVTGIAGPDGGTPQKPVGLVYIGYGIKGGVVQVKTCNFSNQDRQEVRLHTTREVFKILLSIL
jgi:nicotinamide-nucleotide amidase